MDKSESIKELATALNKAQDEMGGADKSAANPFFKSKYADLASVVRAIKQPFADNGLSYSQFPFYEEGCAGVETFLMHKSGEWMSSRLSLPLGKKDAQGAGSAITYARRYSLQSMAGVPSDDDDGNLASSKPTQKKALTKTDMDWISSVKMNPKVLDEITDPKYKAFIKKEAGL